MINLRIAISERQRQLILNGLSMVERQIIDLNAVCRSDIIRQEEAMHVHDDWKTWVRIQRDMIAQNEEALAEVRALVRTLEAGIHAA